MTLAVRSRVSLAARCAAAAAVALAAVSPAVGGQVTAPPPRRPALVLTGPGAGVFPVVNVFDAEGRSLETSFFAYRLGFTGGVRVAGGDVNGDGIDDIVTGAGPRLQPIVRVFDGAGRGRFREFMPESPLFRGGVHVAAGDVNGDGRADIITGAGPGGGPHVAVFDGRTQQLLSSFFAYDPAFRGGVTVAAGDVNGDGRADIITGAGPGGGPHVKVFDGTNGNLLRSFFAFSPQFTGGVFVAAGDVNGDKTVDLVVGAGPGGGPLVRVFDGEGGTVLLDFDAGGGGVGFTGGVHVAAGDVNGDGFADVITGSGVGSQPHVKVFDGRSGRRVIVKSCGLGPDQAATFRDFLVLA